MSHDGLYTRFYFHSRRLRDMIDATRGQKGIANSVDIAMVD